MTILVTSRSTLSQSSKISSKPIILLISKIHAMMTANYSNFSELANLKSKM